MDHRSASPYAPLPGTRGRPRGIFVDRWGTLLENAGPGRSFAESTFVAGAADALFRAHRAGWKIYLIGNEDTVANGTLERSAWHQLERELIAALQGTGALIQRSYADLEGAQGVGDTHLESVFRLPNTGALYHATHSDGIRLDQSWVVGDSTLELVAGWRAGCRLAGVRTGLALSDAAYHVEPEVLGRSLVEAIGEILAIQPVPSR